MKSLKSLLILIIMMSSIFAVIGKVQVYKGSVKVAPGGQNPVKAYRYQEVNSGDVIYTAANGYAEILLNDNTLLRVAPRSRFVISGSDSSRTVDLKKGKLWSSIKKLTKGQKLNFKTPVAVAGVRGTIVRIEAGENGNDRFACEEGAIEMLGQGGAGQILEQNREMRSSGGSLGSAGEYDPSREERWERFTAAIYLRELNLLKTKIEALDKEISSYDLGRVNEELKKEVNGVSREELAARLAYLNLVSKDLNGIIFRTRDCLKDIRRIYSSREVDPEKPQYDAIYNSIKSLYQQSVKPDYERIRKLTARIDAVRAAIKQALAVSETVSGAVAEGAELIKQKAAELGGLKQEIQGVQQQLDYLQNRLKQGNPEALEDAVETIKEIKDSLGDIQEQAEFLYSDIKLYLKDNPDQRKALSAAYKKAKVDFTAVIKGKIKVDNQLSKLLAAVNKAGRGPAAGLSGEDEIIRISGKVREQLNKIEKDIQKIYNGALDRAAREEILSSLQVRIRRVSKWARQLKDQELIKRSSDLVQVISDLGSYLDLPAAEDGTQLSPDEQKVVNELKSVYKALSREVSSLNAILKEMDNLQNIEIDDQAVLDARLKELEKKAAAVNLKNERIAKLKQRYDKLSAALRDSDNAEIASLLSSIDSALAAIETGNTGITTDDIIADLEKSAGKNIDEATQELLQNMRMLVLDTRKADDRVKAAVRRFVPEIKGLDYRIRSKVDAGSDLLISLYNVDTSAAAEYLEVKNMLQSHSAACQNVAAELGGANAMDITLAGGLVNYIVSQSNYTAIQTAAMVAKVNEANTYFNASGVDSPESKISRMQQGMYIIDKNMAALRMDIYRLLESHLIERFFQQIESYKKDLDNLTTEFRRLDEQLAVSMRGQKGNAVKLYQDLKRQFTMMEREMNKIIVSILNKSHFAVQDYFKLKDDVTVFGSQHGAMIDTFRRNFTPSEFNITRNGVIQVKQNIGQISGVSPLP